MKENKPVNIKIKVDDEETLYTPFTPDPDLNYHIKAYIKTKSAGIDYKSTIALTVISKSHIDEDKFMTAIANWISDEKAIFRRTEKDTKKMLFGMLIFGSIMFVLSLFLVDQNDLLKYSILPLIGSFALGRAVRIMIMELPMIHAQKWLLNEMGKTSIVNFEYEK